MLLTFGCCSESSIVGIEPAAKQPRFRLFLLLKQEEDPTRLSWWCHVIKTAVHAYYVYRKRRVGWDRHFCTAPFCSTEMNVCRTNTVEQFGIVFLLCLRKHSCRSPPFDSCRVRLKEENQKQPALPARPSESAAHVRDEVIMDTGGAQLPHPQDGCQVAKRCTTDGGFFPPGQGKSAHGLAS